MPQQEVGELFAVDTRPVLVLLCLTEVMHGLLGVIRREERQAQHQVAEHVHPHQMGWVLDYQQALRIERKLYRDGAAEGIRAGQLLSVLEASIADIELQAETAGFDCVGDDPVNQDIGVDALSDIGGRPGALRCGSTGHGATGRRRAHLVGQPNIEHVESEGKALVEKVGERPPGATRCRGPIFVNDREGIESDRELVRVHRPWIDAAQDRHASAQSARKIRQIKDVACVADDGKEKREHHVDQADAERQHMRVVERRKHQARGVAHIQLREGEPIGPSFPPTSAPADAGQGDLDRLPAREGAVELQRKGHGRSIQGRGTQTEHGRGAATHRFSRDAPDRRGRRFRLAQVDREQIDTGAHQQVRKGGLGDRVWLAVRACEQQFPAVLATRWPKKWTAWKSSPLAWAAWSVSVIASRVACGRRVML